MFNCNRKYDLKLGQKLCDAQGIDKGASGRLLDIGSGTGVLVYECWRRGVDSCGCEIAPSAQGYSNERIYKSAFRDVHFPTDRFRWVTALSIPDDYHAMIEVLAEAFRVTAQEGAFYAGLPLVFYQEGVAQMLRAGFVDVREIGKDENRAMFSAKKPAQKRSTLLLPPGIGDIYWPLVKAEAFFKREGIATPVDAYVAAPRAKKYDSHARGFPFIEMFPFLNSTGEVRFNRRDPVWREAYLRQGRSIFENVQGCDYFLTWNGYLRAGKSLEEVDPDLECNWFLPRFVSLEEENYRKDCVARYGEYLVLYWAFRGTNRLIFKHFSLNQIAGAIGAIVKATGLTPILVGAIWDMDDLELEKLRLLLPKNTIDLRGKTNTAEIFGLMRGAKAVVGMNSGISIMAGVFGVKTILLYHEYLFSNGVHRDFAVNTFPPAVRNKTYFPEFADTATPEGFAARAISVIQDTPYVKKEETTRKAGQGVMEVPREVSRGGHVSIRDSARPRPFHTTIACVLKTGGDFDERYVINLKRSLDRNLTHSFKFVCLTDLPEIKEVETIRLSNGHPGWWSKIELFRPGLVATERILYFDLDTLILKNIDDLLTLGGDFYGLRPWNRANREKGNCASGIMAWKNGTYDFLYGEFDADKINRLGDQVYISAALKAHGGTFTPLQDAAPGIYSYKRECRQGGPPRGARIVCFHGRPRVHEVGDRWVKEAWG